MQVCTLFFFGGALCYCVQQSQPVWSINITHHIKRFKVPTKQNCHTHISVTPGALGILSLLTHISVTLEAHGAWHT